MRGEDIMLVGTVYFYDDFKRVILELDIEDFNFSQREFFDKILEIGATKVVVRGVSNNHQSKESETVLYSERY